MGKPLSCAAWGEANGEQAESDTPYWRMTAAARVLAPQSTGTWVRQWFRVWRWPAGLVAALVLWLALVAVVGAATSVSRLVDRQGLAASM